MEKKEKNKRLTKNVKKTLPNSQFSLEAKRVCLYRQNDYKQDVFRLKFS